MRFQSLRVCNLRAVRLFEVSDLKDFIVIAGQNGSGKSCVFDAIRLLKSVYGGYSQDEFMQWFGEFAINVQDKGALRRMFRDPASGVEVSATIEFAPSEREFLTNHASDLLWPLAWQRVTGQRMDHWSFNRMAIATQLDQYREPVESLVAELEQVLRKELESESHTIALCISPDGNFELADCLPAQVSFQAFEPESLGIIEYHSASRAYVRQPLQGINLDSRAFQEQRRQQILYNQQAKYQNVKTELATGYLQTLVAQESGEEVAGADLNETLRELFQTFFPDKSYDGVRPLPGGSLEFPVRLKDGGTHDIDDLSSGEKEILYGYLRLRNSTPRSSVILLDEPELHLNPSLLEGFADFYHQHLGLEQGNQLWLVTHSDTLLRQAIGNSNYCVYHMVTASSSEGNQAAEVLLDDDVERVVVDLVGDLAAYRPHAKVVILEGKNEDGFDEMAIKRLFPEFAKRVNLVSAGPKRRVGGLYEALNSAAEKVGMGNRFFAIVDSDSEGFRVSGDAPKGFAWDVYHVENFILEPAYIRAATKSLTGSDPFSSDEAVLDALKTAAAEIIDQLVIEQVRWEVNRDLVSAIDLGGPSNTDEVADAMKPSLEGSLTRLAEKGKDYVDSKLEQRAAEVKAEFQSVLEDGAWLKRFPGRLVLRRFVGSHLQGVAYEPFRNLVLEKMAASTYRPENMQTILDEILAA